MSGLRITFADDEVIEFNAVTGASVLEAAEQSGYTLAQNCRSGICRTCVAQRPDGSRTFLCQERAEPGFMARVPYARADLVPATMRKARINGFAQVSPSVWQLRYRLQFPLAFLPGQYVELSLPGIEGSRRFSMANAPGDAEHILYIRDLPHGAVPAYLRERAKVNDLFSLRGPLGVFYLRRSTRPKLFIAGGTGLAPILAMLRELSRHDISEPLALVFGVTNAADAFALDEIRALAQKLPLEVALAAVTADAAWPGREGTVVDAVPDLWSFPIHAGIEAYICGPPGMVAAARGMLEGKGADPDHIFNEEFIENPRSVPA